jgi:hypothetical protein
MHSQKWPTLWRADSCAIVNAVPERHCRIGYRLPLSIAFRQNCHRQIGLRQIFWRYHSNFIVACLSRVGQISEQTATRHAHYMPPVCLNCYRRPFGLVVCRPLGLIVSAARLVCSSPSPVWFVRRRRPSGLIVTAARLTTLPSLAAAAHSPKPLRCPHCSLVPTAVAR